MSEAKRRVTVTGAGGFIGHHLVKRLKGQGHWVRGVDLRLPEYDASPADEFLVLDLRDEGNCRRAAHGVQDVYQLAADMGGIGYISHNHATLSRNNVLINAHMLEAARLAKVQRYLYTSSACVYPSFKQHDEHVTPLTEQDAIPADPEKGYGWEKLFAEQLTRYYHEDHGLDARIVRFHNIYGPLGAYEGGKEKAPGALMRKAAEARDGDAIPVWGDGLQTRSFCHVDDCVEGLTRLMDSGWTEPLNLGTDELVTVNQLVDLCAEAAGKKLRKVHDLSKPQGVRGRNSDNALLRKVLDWEPRIALRDGIARTYPWVWQEMAKQGRARPPVPRRGVR
ncbi:MAG: NAD-dependent epimerase/dehydratase family protein [Halobacteriales archaeon]|nr:NAD-dependent epimerase/dehydratase family protein [Halobacteriales archaeon]